MKLLIINTLLSALITSDLAHAALRGSVYTSDSSSCLEYGEQCSFHVDCCDDLRCGREYINSLIHGGIHVPLNHWVVECQNKRTLPPPTFMRVFLVSFRVMPKNRLRRQVVARKTTKGLDIELGNGMTLARSQKNRYVF